MEQWKLDRFNQGQTLFTIQILKKERLTELNTGIYRIKEGLNDSLLLTKIPDINDLDTEMLFICYSDINKIGSYIISEHDFLFNHKWGFVEAICTSIAIKQKTKGYTEEFLNMFKSNMAIAPDPVKYLDQFKDAA